MSFIYSQALVAASLPANCSDTDACAPSSGSPTPKPCLWHDKTMDASRHSRFGMTCKPLTDDLGAELLTSWLAAFRVKTSQSQGGVQASPESAAECGSTWRASLARFDPATSSWKTAQHSLLEDLELSLVIWPRSGMTAAGQCWELPMSGRRTSATGFGLWATPSASDSTRGGTITDSMTGISLVQQMNTPHRWPTPTTQDNAQVRGVGAAANASRRGTTLGGAVRLWPTPCATDHKGAGKQGALRDRLDYAVERGATKSKTYATPQARDFRTGQTSRWEDPNRSRNLNDQIGGQLNPTWVEWLMGWPIGHTDLKPLATDKFQQWQQQHGVC